MRELYMLPSLHSWLYQRDRSKSQDYKPHIRAHLGRYVKGREIDNCEYMKHLCDEVWEFRVQFSSRRRENTRVFGSFVHPDKFIATHWRLRGSLGDKADPRWRETIDLSIRHIRDLSPSLQRVSAVPFSNCVTFAAIEC